MKTSLLHKTFLFPFLKTKYSNFTLKQTKNTRALGVSAEAARRSFDGQYALPQASFLGKVMRDH